MALNLFIVRPFSTVIDILLALQVFRSPSLKFSQLYS